MEEGFIDRLGDLFINLLPKLPGLIIGLIAGYLLIRLLTFLLRRVLKVVRLNKALIDITVSLGNVLLWILLLSELLRQAGLNNLALTISGSLVALGFALANGTQALTGDIIAGLFLARDKDFECGYRVKIGDIEGVVDKIDIRKVRIKSDDGKVHVLPNSKVDNANGWTIISRK